MRNMFFFVVRFLFFIKAPVRYPVGYVQEIDKDTDLDIMLRDRWWEHEIKT